MKCMKGESMVVVKGVTVQRWLEPRARHWLPFLLVRERLSSHQNNESRVYETTFSFA
jgi:hypothetical protein